MSSMDARVSLRSPALVNIRFRATTRSDSALLLVIDMGMSLLLAELSPLALIGRSLYQNFLVTSVLPSRMYSLGESG